MRPTRKDPDHAAVRLFVDAAQVVAGVSVLEAEDLDQALRIARTNPVVRGGRGGGVEVCPIHSGGVVRPPRA